MASDTRVAATLRAWLALARATVMAPWRNWRLAPDPFGIHAGAHIWQDEIDALIRDLGDTAHEGWVSVPYDHGPYTATNSLIAAQLRQSRNLLINIPDETYRLIVNAMADAAKEGKSTAQIAAIVDDLLDPDDGSFWPNRAATIARTETHRAFYAGVWAAAIGAQNRTGVFLYKRWQARETGETRTWHHDADGQTVAVSGRFLVGPDALAYPGDPAGMPQNVINCRCRMTITDHP